MKRMNVIAVFNKDLTKTLMCKRRKEPYKNLYNFVGGKIEKDNSIEEVNKLEWIDMKENFFDYNKFAGEGNIGHIMLQIKKDINNNK